MRTSPVPAVVYLIAVAATPYPGSYWAVAFLALVVLVQAASVPGPMRVGRSVLLAVGWSGVTVLWSVAPSLTVRNVALLALLTAAAALLPRVLGPGGAPVALATACRVLLVASWSLYLLAPAAGRTQDVYQYGTFEGVFVQRNVAAFFCVVATITFLVRAAEGSRRRLDLGWAGLAVATLLATSSGTGLAVLMASVGVTIALVVASRARTVRRRRLVVAAAILPAVALALWLPFNLGVISGLFGRDATLTGRSVIWEVVERVLAGSPWLGQGSGALWVAGVPVTDRMWAQAGFAFYHAHSAYLDHLVQTGVVGLALVLTVVLLALRRSVRRLVESGHVPAMWPAGVLVCLLFYGIDEQSFASSFGWLLVVLAAALAAPDSTDVPRTPPLDATHRTPPSRAVRPRTQPLAPSGHAAMEVSGVR